MLEPISLFRPLNACLEALYLAVSSFELAEDSIEVDVLQNLEILHFVLKLVHPLALGVLVLLKAGLLVIEVLQLALQLFD